MNIKKELISPTECANRLGVTPTTMYKGLNSGRFKYYTRKGRRVVDFKDCKRIFIQTATNSGDKPKGKLAKKISDGEKQKSLSIDSELLHISDVRLMMERNKALKEKLQLEILQGKYVDYEKVKKEFCSIAENLKKSILAIPTRIGPIIAGEDDAHTVVQILTKELKQSLHGTVEQKVNSYEQETS